jgi:hypothetical protein
LISKLSHTAAAQWLKTRLQTPGKRGQSFIELALVLPVLLIMLAGMTEVAFFVGRYLDMLDLTREAARFASVREFRSVQAASAFNCSDNSGGAFDFYYDTACIFSPPLGSTVCPKAIFCNGFNPYITMNMATDDIVITVFTLGGHPGDPGATPPTSPTYSVTNVHPGDINIIALGEDNTFITSPADYIIGKPGYWALSAQAGYMTGGVDNWKKDCQGNPTGATAPYYTAARVNSMINPSDPNITRNKGFVAVEFYYCYTQVLGLPIVSQIMPNPARIHAYTLMPLPSSQPTPTVIPPP